MSNQRSYRQTFFGIGGVALIAAAFISSVGMAALSGGQTESSQLPNYINWTMPGLTINSPSGFGADWGQLFVGGGFQNRARFTTTADGAIGAGFGIGDSNKYVGVETSVSVYDVSQFSNGGINVKVHRNLPEFFSVAVGREGLVTWGNGSSDVQSWYGTVSKIFFLKRDPQAWFSALTLTAGLGNGRFLSQSNIATNQALTGNPNASGTGVNPFGSASVRIQEPVSFIADWTGQDLNLGLSITPIRTLGLFINPTLADLTHSAGDGVRFVLGGGLAYSFL